MTLIKQYVQAMLNQDSVALSKLFSPTAIFVDYCPKDAGQPQLHAYGPEGIDMFFRNRFLFRRFEITDPLIVSDTQAYYYAVYNGYHIRAVATIQDFSVWWSVQPEPSTPAPIGKRRLPNGGFFSVLAWNFLPSCTFSSHFSVYSA